MTSRRQGLPRRRALAAAGFLAPALALYLLFTIGPLLAVFGYSVLRFEGVGVAGLAGWDNYARLWSSGVLRPQVVNAFVNNCWFFAGTMVVQNVVSLGLALLLHRQGWGRRFFQAVIAVPFLVNPLVVGYVWTLLLNPIFGPVASFMVAVGAEDAVRPWLGDPAWARPLAVLINAWQWVGFPMLVYGAALGAIPEEVFQAARLDRASRWQAFRWVTLPLLLPAIGTVTILTFIGCFNSFSLQFALGGLNGAPAGANDVLGLVFYRQAFSGDINAIGLSSALATMTFAFIFVVAVLMRRGLTRVEERYE